MASRRIPAPGRFALGATMRAAAGGALAFGVLVAAERHLWATAIVLLAALVLVGRDLARSATAADRLLAQFVEGVTAEGYARPAPQAGLREASAAIQRALDRLAAARADRQQRVDHLEALLDNVAASLLVVDGDGQVVSANRAARQSLGAAPGSIAAIPALPAATAVRLRTLPAGSREIVRLANGRAMLAHGASFIAQGRTFTLISLQSLSGELDVVQLKAWQDLVRILAHEIMNSLTPILSLAESLKTRLPAAAVADELIEDLEVITRRSAGLMHFVERYRALSDVPAPEPIKIRAAELAASLDRLMGPMMAEAAVNYASLVTPRTLAFDADPDLLEQALINLLKNALEAVRGRDGSTIRLGIQALEDAQIALVVEDNGPGLPDDDPEAVFVPFYSTKPGGSGVGLTLARQIALAHGGRLDHLPQQCGAAFRLVLPAVASTPVAA